MYYDGEALLEDEGVGANDDNRFFNAKDFTAILKGVKENDPETKQLYVNGGNRSVSEMIRRMTEEEWEVLGRIVANNMHLMYVKFNNYALDDETISALFRGLMRSNSITHAADV